MAHSTASIPDPVGPVSREPDSDGWTPRWASTDWSRPVLLQAALASSVSLGGLSFGNSQTTLRASHGKVHLLFDHGSTECQHSPPVVIPSPVVPRAHRLLSDPAAASGCSIRFALPGNGSQDRARTTWPPVVPKHTRTFPSPAARDQQPPRPSCSSARGCSRSAIWSTSPETFPASWVSF